MRFLINSNLLVFLCFILPFNVLSEDNHFEGQISFVKQTHYDTLHIHYFVKGEKVRINQYTNDGILLFSFLADLESEKVFALDPEQKLFKELNLMEQTEGTNRYHIKKTRNTRLVNDVKCYQWRVRDKQTNSEVAYWVTQSNFEFMNDLFRLISKTDPIYHFFTHIPEQKGFFPMLSVERTLLRKERQRIMVQQINMKDMDDRLFSIPPDYNAFQ